MVYPCGYIMECPICNGKMEKIKDEIEQDKVEFEAFKCNSHGEEIMDMKQPNEIIHEYKITSGKQGILTKDKEGIKIIPT